MGKKTRILSPCLILVIFALSAGLVIGNYLSEARYKGEIERLNRHIEELKERINTLQVWLDGNITTYQDYISELERNLRIEILGVYFSPKGGCENAIIEWISRANKSIHILIYSFTLDSISDAIIDAYERGVDVKIVFEQEQITQYSEYWKLKEVGVPVRNDTNPYSMHNKVMIVDEEIVITGSYNWSSSAENRNNENMIVIRSREIAEIYEGEFEKIWEESV